MVEVRARIPASPVSAARALIEVCSPLGLSSTFENSGCQEPEARARRNKESRLQPSRYHVVANRACWFVTIGSRASGRLEQDARARLRDTRLEMQKTSDALSNEGMSDRGPTATHIGGNGDQSPPVSRAQRPFASPAGRQAGKRTVWSHLVNEGGRASSSAGIPFWRVEARDGDDDFAVSRPRVSGVSPAGDGPAATARSNLSDIDA